MSKLNLKSKLGVSILLSALSFSANTAQIKSLSNQQPKKNPITVKKESTINVKDVSESIKTMRTGSKTERADISI